MIVQLPLVKVLALIKLCRRGLLSELETVSLDELEREVQQAVGAAAKRNGAGHAPDYSGSNSSPAGA